MFSRSRLNLIAVVYARANQYNPIRSVVHARAIFVVHPLPTQHISNSGYPSFLSSPTFLLPSSSAAMNDPVPTSTSSFASPKQISFNSQQRDSAASKSPSLASLEWLQNQRRGSITDPSLHAASNVPSNMKLNTAFRQQPEQSASASSAPSSAHHDSAFRPHLPEPRPASPYVFGDATPQQPEHGSQIQIHKLLRSPEDEQNGHRVAPSVSHESQDPPRNYIRACSAVFLELSS